MEPHSKLPSAPPSGVSILKSSDSKQFLSKSRRHKTSKRVTKRRRRPSFDLEPRDTILCTPSLLVNILHIASAATPKYIHLSSVAYIYDNRKTSKCLLDLLPLSSLLALRLVNHEVKRWVDRIKNRVFETLHLDFPPTVYQCSVAAHHSFARVAELCRIMRLDVSPPSVKQFGSQPSFEYGLNHGSIGRVLVPDTINAFFTRLSNVTDLSISVRDPAHSSSYPTLVALRAALESSIFPSMTHISFSPLTFSGLLAMRWGPLTTIVGGGWMGRRFWARVRSLELEVVPWWEEDEDEEEGYDDDPKEQQHQEEGRKQYSVDKSRKLKPDTTTKAPWEGETLRPGVEMSNDNSDTTMMHLHRRRSHQHHRGGIKVLHDFLSSFAPTLQVLKFSWVAAPAPILVSLLSNHHTSPLPPFSNNSKNNDNNNDDDNDRSSTVYTSLYHPSTISPCLSPTPTYLEAFTPELSGPNPVLLDLLPAGHLKNFSAPPLALTSLTTLWLSSIAVSAADIPALLARAPRLEKLYVAAQYMDCHDEAYWLGVVDERGRTVVVRRVDADGEVWWDGMDGEGDLRVEAGGAVVGKRWADVWIGLGEGDEEGEGQGDGGFVGEDDVYGGLMVGPIVWRE